ncbi:ribulokinase [Peptococcaceae bacterium CEB3]|nr:ribulokinase [Peptococcaceae bacterium CEB3]
MAYAIGVDYGTQSGRVILLDLHSGHEKAISVVPYKHGVIDSVLPTTGTKLPVDWALQDPSDYLEVLHEGIPMVMREGKVNAGDVIGLGVDFTSCTVLPVNEDGMPLCLMSRWQNHPHAWPKLWKHHSAQPIADRINQVAERRGEEFLSRYGGRISAEWYFPKLIEVFEEDREVYNACYRFVEATDWIVWYLTGEERRNSCTAGYKAMWSEHEGIPGTEFFASVSSEFVNPKEKLGEVFYPLGTRAGYLKGAVADKLQLHSGVAVAVGNVDAMVSVPSVGVKGLGALVMVMGTSICHLAVTKEESRFEGITGVVKDGVLPGYYGYEAGQAAVGDMFEWFVKKLVPQAYFKAAASYKVSIFEHLENLAAKLLPGESGLIALDWWNGNRSILGDADLSGIILGFTLSTAPEAIYRTLLESTAFGTRRIVENFTEHGVAIDRLVACGGLAQRSPLLMRIYADACGLPVSVASSTEIPARGSAMFGAVAAGKEHGGFESITEASQHLVSPVLKSYLPEEVVHRKYNELYQIYREIHDFFGIERVDILHRLKGIRMNSAV